jgi:hypothetical protein
MFFFPTDSHHRVAVILFVTCKIQQGNERSESSHFIILLQYLDQLPVLFLLTVSNSDNVHQQIFVLTKFKILFGSYLMYFLYLCDKSEFDGRLD